MDDAVANDLRLLKLADLYEGAYERFVREVALPTVEDETTRTQLARLAAARGSPRERIVAERRRIERELRPEDEAAVEVGALRDVIEVERAARDFHLSVLDDLHDPKLVALFRQIAREDDRRVEAAERILDHARGAQPAGRATSGGQDASTSEELPLREGVADFGMPGKPRFPGP